MAELFGRVEDRREVDRYLGELTHPMFAPAAGDGVKDSGKGKIALLFKCVERLHGFYPIQNQTIGDCVSQGSAGAVQDVMAADIIRRNDPEDWAGIVATEPIYALSRVEIGGGRLSGDGSLGSWAAKAVREYGVLLRKKYGKHDFRRYSGRKARAMGKRGAGLPDELEPIAREHPIRTTSLVTSWEDVRDAVANYYGVTVASNIGFVKRRDKDGFAKQSGTWNHQMRVIAIDDSYRRPGGLLMNSWGPKWITGGKRHGQPEGSFFVDADVIDRMVRQQDSWAYSDFEGFPRKEIDWSPF